jgi:hypothetical protein
MEVIMDVMLGSLGLALAVDEKLVASLKRMGPLTIEELLSQSGMSWAQMFASVDRLSRTGAVMLRRIGAEYQVAYNLHC